MVVETEEAMQEPDSAPGRVPMTLQLWVPNPPAPRIPSLMPVPGDTSNCALNHCCAFMYQEHRPNYFLAVFLLTG